MGSVAFVSGGRLVSTENAGVHATGDVRLVRPGRRRRVFSGREGMAWMQRRRFRIHQAATRVSFIQTHLTSLQHFNSHVNRREELNSLNSLTPIHTAYPTCPEDHYSCVTHLHHLKFASPMETIPQMHQSTQ